MYRLRERLEIRISLFRVAEEQKTSFPPMETRAHGTRKRLAELCNHGSNLPDVRKIRLESRGYQLEVLNIESDLRSINFITSACLSAQLVSLSKLGSRSPAPQKRRHSTENRNVLPLRNAQCVRFTIGIFGQQKYRSQAFHSLQVCLHLFSLSLEM